ncbi:helix-turn-helix transcriptional regulator [Miniimonas sp. S16]|uniref:helix-turn-helix domain-containing protein n=1 Tax=Miniimonas sp. S16 TaxID=2171623 RepID=UPI00131F1B00|nr:helix-turn-helix transcriptional regulator [Miniimonas sp. S16]
MRLKSPQMLRQFMAYQDVNVRELAKAAGLGHATVGHLRSGARSTCSAETARAIEGALQAPPGLLFDPVASIVSRETARKAVA